MGNKGFTLIELIAVFVVMGIIIGIVIPAGTKMLNSNNQKENEIYIENIEKAVYAIADIEYKTSDGEYSVSIKELINKNYLTLPPKIKYTDYDKIKFCKKTTGVEINSTIEILDGKLNIT